MDWSGEVGGRLILFLNHKKVIKFVLTCDTVFISLFLQKHYSNNDSNKINHIGLCFYSRN